MRYLKAIFGAASAGLGSLAIAYMDNVITNQEIVTIAIVTVGALSVIWGVPNSPTINDPNQPLNAPDTIVANVNVADKPQPTGV